MLQGSLLNRNWRINLMRSVTNKMFIFFFASWLQRVILDVCVSVMGHCFLSWQANSVLRRYLKQLNSELWNVAKNKNVDVDQKWAGNEVVIRHVCLAGHYSRVISIISKASKEGELELFLLLRRSTILVDWYILFWLILKMLSNIFIFLLCCCNFDFLKLSQTDPFTSCCVSHIYIGLNCFVQFT